MDGLDGLRPNQESKKSTNDCHVGDFSALRAGRLHVGSRSVMELSPFGRLFPSERAPGADSPPVALSTCMMHLMRKKSPDFSTIC